MREKSLDFLGFPNYSVTDDGRVFSLNYHNEGYKKELKQCLCKGYFIVGLYNKVSKRKIFFVHRLVALAFISNPDNLPLINHKDENPLNNNVGNLEWCSIKYNNTYGTRLERVSKKHLNRKDESKSVKQYTKDGVFIREYPSMHEVKRQTGYDFSFISRCCRGRTKSAYGYIWRYA